MVGFQAGGLIGDQRVVGLVAVDERPCLIENWPTRPEAELGRIISEEKPPRSICSEIAPNIPVSRGTPPFARR